MHNDKRYTPISHVQKCILRITYILNRQKLECILVTLVHMLTVVSPCCSSGSLSHSECSSPSLITPPLSPLNLETSSFASSQSQGSISTLPRISVSPVPTEERRKDRYKPAASGPSCCAPSSGCQATVRSQALLSDSNNWTTREYRIMYVEGSDIHICTVRTHFNPHHHIKLKFT